MVTALRPNDMFEIADMVLIRNGFVSSEKSKTSAEPGSWGGGDDECERDGRDEACVAWRVLCSGIGGRSWANVSFEVVMAV